MKRILGLLSLLGFLLALSVHIGALMGIDVSEQVPGVWGLHVGMFVVFIPFVLSSRNSLGLKPKFAEIRAAFPAWVVVFGVCLFAYAVVNFLLCLPGAQEGNSSMVDGKYALVKHGKVIRELTAAEYTAQNAAVLRAFSGHWLVFYFVPFAYFLFCRAVVAVGQPEVALRIHD